MNKIITFTDAMGMRRIRMAREIHMAPAGSFLLVSTTRYDLAYWGVGGGFEVEFGVTEVVVQSDREVRP